MPTIEDYNRIITEQNNKLAQIRARLQIFANGDSWAIWQSERDNLQNQIDAAETIKASATRGRDNLITARTWENLANNPNVIANSFISGNDPLLISWGSWATTTQWITNRTNTWGSAIGTSNTSWTANTNTTTTSDWTPLDTTLFNSLQWWVVDAAGNLVANPWINSGATTGQIASNLSWRVDRILDFIGRSRAEQLWATWELRDASLATTRSQLDRLWDFFTQARRWILANQSVQQGIASWVGRRAWASTAQRLATQSNLQAQSQDQLWQLGLSQLENERGIQWDFVNRLGSTIDAENAIRSTTDTARANLQSWLASDLSGLGQNELSFQRWLADQLRLQWLEWIVGTPTWVAWTQAVATWATTGTTWWWGWWTSSWGGWVWTTTYRTNTWGTTTVPTWSTPPADAVTVVSTTPSAFDPSNNWLLDVADIPWFKFPAATSVSPTANTNGSTNTWGQTLAQNSSSIYDWWFTPAPTQRTPWTFTVWDVVWWTVTWLWNLYSGLWQWVVSAASAVPKIANSALNVVAAGWNALWAWINREIAWDREKQRRREELIAQWYSSREAYLLVQ